MKTEEDEAFDDLARKQGMWGGGFHAKRAAAADKLQEPAQSKEFQVIPGIGEAGAEHMAQPAQEPVAWMWKDMRGQDVVSLFEPRLNSIPLYTAPPKRERVLFPTMLRKMWSGSEVQAWLDENVNKEQNNG